MQVNWIGCELSNERVIVQLYIFLHVSTMSNKDLG